MFISMTFADVFVLNITGLAVAMLSLRNPVTLATDKQTIIDTNISRESCSKFDFL